MLGNNAGYLQINQRKKHVTSVMMTFWMRKSECTQTSVLEMSVSFEATNTAASGLCCLCHICTTRLSRNNAVHISQIHEYTVCCSVHTCLRPGPNTRSSNAALRGSSGCSPLSSHSFTSLPSTLLHLSLTLCPRAHSLVGRHPPSPVSLTVLIPLCASRDCTHLGLVSVRLKVDYQHRRKTLC